MLKNNATSATASPSKTRPRHEDVVQRLEHLVATLQPGERIPTHTELMRRLHLSERATLRALEDLQRTGRIVRRNGVGTFVADARTGLTPVAPTVVGPTRPIINVITIPGAAFFDRCMDLLFWHAEVADVSFVCRIVDSGVTTDLDALPGDASGEAGTFLFFSQRLAPLAKRLQDRGARVAVVGVPPQGAVIDVPCIYGNHEEGCHLAVNHLLDLGHRHIAFAEIAPWSQRFRGGQRAIREAQAKHPDARLTMFTAEDVFRWYEQPHLSATAFRTGDAPTAVICWSDREAALILATLTRAGIRVPEDVSLVGYDALPEGAMVYPALTTIDQHIGRQISAALDLLTQPLVAEPGCTVVIPPTLIARESSAAPPTSEPVSD